MSQRLSHRAGLWPSLDAQLRSAGPGALIKLWGRAAPARVLRRDP